MTAVMPMVCGGEALSSVENTGFLFYPLYRRTPWDKHEERSQALESSDQDREPGGGPPPAPPRPLSRHEEL